MELNRGVRGNVELLELELELELIQTHMIQKPMLRLKCARVPPQKHLGYYINIRGRPACLMLVAKSKGGSFY